MMGINVKKLLCAASAAVCSASVFAAAPAAPEARPVPRKIVMLIADCGTIDTVAKTEEFLTQISKVSNAEMPQLSPAERAAVTPAMEREIVRVNWNTRKTEYLRERQSVESENRRMANVLYQLRNSILSDQNRRNVVVGKNYLQSFFQKYSSCIQIIDRANSSISEVEKAIGGNSQVDVASSTMFLSVIVQDLKTTRSTVPVGRTNVTRTTYTQKMVANVRDYNGNVLFACHVVAQKSFRQTDVVRTEGFNPADELLEDGWRQIAEKVAAHFLTELDIRVKGPRNDNDFEADDVIITVDGREISGGKVRVLAINHAVRASLDGYQTVEREIEISEGTPVKRISIRFKRAAAPAPAPAAAPAAAK